jgi:hypothetical protein
VVLIYLREIYRLVGTDKQGWNRRVALTEEAIADLRWLLANMRKRQGGPIWRPSRILVVKTDASGYGWGGCIPECCQEARGSFSEEERTWRIHRKELWAVLGTVLSHKSAFRGRQVEFLSNNLMVVRYLREGGGRDWWMAGIVKRIWQIMDSIGATIHTAQWIHGVTENAWADALSRFRETDDWQLRPETVESIRQALGPWQVDRFADGHSATVPVFNSRFATPGTAAVDAFTQDWGTSVSLLVPPVSLLGRTITHAIECRAKAILVAPTWEAHDWWPLLRAVKVLTWPLGSGEQMARPGRREHSNQGRIRRGSGART